MSGLARSLRGRSGNGPSSVRSEGEHHCPHPAWLTALRRVDQRQGSGAGKERQAGEQDGGGLGHGAGQRFKCGSRWGQGRSAVVVCCVSPKLQAGGLIRMDLRGG